MRTSLLSKLLLGVAVLAAAQIVVESRAFAIDQLAPIGVRTNSLTLTGGAIQMATYNTGVLVGGKIVDNSAPGFDTIPVVGNPDILKPTLAMARLQGDIQTWIGQAAGPGLTWTGSTGFTDPAAAADYLTKGNLTAVAAVVNGTLKESGGYYVSGYANFAGKPAAADSILIAHTYYGDTNLTGDVNGDDYLNFLQGLTSGGKDPNGNPAGWAYGDFNGSGGVNGDDYLLFLGGLTGQSPGGIFPASFNSSAPSGSWVLSSAPQIVSQASAGSVSAVPEPGTFALLFAFGALVASRAYILRAKKSVA